MHVLQCLKKCLKNWTKKTGEKFAVHWIDKKSDAEAVNEKKSAGRSAKAFKNSI